MNNALEIENFLIFKKVKIDVNKITIFIGPQIVRCRKMNINGPQNLFSGRGR